MYKLAKAVFLKVVPKNWVRKSEPVLRRVLYQLFYKGKKHSCSVCKAELNQFIEHNHLGFQDKICPNCGSLGRTRTLIKLLENEYLNTDSIVRLLEFSPHRSSFNYFSNLPFVLYTANDFEDEFLAHTKHDITALPFNDYGYQIIVCYHVLEHVLNDKQAMHELYRVLDSNGVALLQVPFLIDQPTLENPAYNTPELRLEHYGQEDHVRYYGLNDFVKQLQSVGFECTVLKPNESLFINSCEVEGLNPNEIVVVARKNEKQ